jgi:hypothetical protein
MNRTRLAQLMIKDRQFRINYLLDLLNLRTTRHLLISQKAVSELQKLGIPISYDRMNKVQILELIIQYLESMNIIDTDKITITPPI